MGTFDAIVIGLGGVGSAVTHALARRGANVLGLEQHDLVHDRGSSHGETRIIRKAYFEHPDYVPLLKVAYEGWRALEAERAVRLFERTGLLLVGPEDGAVVAGTRRAAVEHDLPLEVWDASDLSRRFPGFQDAPGCLAVYEADAGFLRVESAVAAFLEGARSRGATLLPHAAVRGWRPDGAGVVVQTAEGEQRAERLVICAGAWAGQLLGTLRPHLRPQRKVQLWLPSRSPALNLGNGPTYGFQVNDSFFYGFPSLDGATVKLAEHGPGVEVPDPSALDRALHPSDLPRVAEFAARHLVGVDGPAVRHSVCMYTLSPDEHFIIDRLPEHPAVSFCAGLSGHGFKFMPALGLALAELALDGATTLPVGFLNASRLAVDLSHSSR